MEQTEVEKVEETNVETATNTEQTEIEMIAKSEVDALINTSKEEALKDYKRELSTKLGVNVFEQTELDSFVTNLTNKVERAELEALETKLVDYNDLLVKSQNQEIENKLLRSSINSKRIDRAKELIGVEVQKGISVEEAVTNLIAEFPEWISTSINQLGANLNGDGRTLTDREAYLEKNYK